MEIDISKVLDQYDIIIGQNTRKIVALLVENEALKQEIDQINKERVDIFYKYEEAKKEIEKLLQKAG